MKVSKIFFCAPFVPPLSRFLPHINYDALAADAREAFDQDAVMVPDGQPVQTLVIKSQMGTGKSTAFLNHISQQPPECRCLVLANRRSLLRNLHGKAPTIAYYDKCSSIEKLRSVPKLCITLESLHRLCGHDLKQPLPHYDIIIIDELPATFMQLLSSTVRDRRLTATVFQHLIASCNVLIACASDCTDQDLAVLQMIRSPPIHQVINSFAQNRESMYMFGDKTDFIQALKTAFKEKQRVYVASDSKSWLDHVRSAIMKPLWPTARVQVYSSDTSKDEGVQTELNAPNEHWPAYDVIFASPSITHGVDFTVKHFAQQFYLVTGRSITCRSMIQAMRRVRVTERHRVNVCTYQMTTSKELPVFSEAISVYGQDWAAWKIGYDGVLAPNMRDWLTVLGIHCLRERMERCHCRLYVQLAWQATGAQVRHIPEETEPGLSSQPIHIPPPTESQAHAVVSHSAQPRCSARMESEARRTLAKTAPPPGNGIYKFFVPFPASVGGKSASEYRGNGANINELLFSFLYQMGFRQTELGFQAWFSDSALCSADQLEKLGLWMWLNEVGDVVKVFQGMRQVAAIAALNSAFQHMRHIYVLHRRERSYVKGQHVTLYQLKEK